MSFMFNPLWRNERISLAQKQKKIGFSLYPDLTSNAIAYYNTVLFNATNGFDMNFMLDNDAFYKCFSQMGQEDPSINDINELLAQAVASTFSNVRFGGSVNIEKLITTLVPKETLRCPTISFASVKALRN